MQQIFLLLGLCISGIHSLYMKESEEILHVEPITNFQVIGLNEGPVTILHDHRQDHADEIEVSFSAFNKKWVLNMYVDHNMFSPTSAFHYFDGEGGEVVRKPHHTLYKTIPDTMPKATLNIHEDGLVHAMIHTEHDVYFVDPIYKLHKKHNHIDSEMGMYRLDDVQGLKIDIPKLSNSSQSRRLLQLNLNTAGIKDSVKYPTTQQSSDIGEPARWQNCYPNQQIEKNFAMGFSVTSQYYRSKGGGSAAGIETELKNLLADTNSIYVPQMGVHLYIEKTDIRTTDAVTGNPPAPWNLKQASENQATWTNNGCGETASDTLGKYRIHTLQNHATDAGLWHLMTTCFPPSGTVGVAYLNAMCNPRIKSGLSSSGTQFTWAIVAHEIGHNFGGEHSFELGQGVTGGIMDYGRNQKINGIWQFNSRFRQQEVCTQIARSQAQPVGTCWSNFVAAGGPTYEWIDSIEQPVCSVSCVPAGSTTPPTQVVKKVCQSTTPPPENTKSIVADNLCAPPKPQNIPTSCIPGPPACTTSCGDGVVTPPETCEGAVGDPCCINCQLTANDPTCIKAVDACFVSIKNERKYCFRGAEYNRYTITQASGTQDNAPDDGYPKIIDGNFQELPAGYKGDFDAVIQRNEGRVYFIKGSNYVVYELGFGASNAPPASAVDFFGLPPTWTSVDAAISTFSGQGGAYIFRDAEYCRFKFADETTNLPTKCSDSVRPITDWAGGNQFPFPKITAASRFWPDIGLRVDALKSAVDMIYEGQYVRYTFGVGLTQTEKKALSAFGTAATATQPKTPDNPGGGSGGTASDRTTCDDVNCADCSIVKNQCISCSGDGDLYALVSGVCYPKEYVAEMLFESYARDRRFIKSTNVENQWTTGEGQTGLGVALTSTSFIELDVSVLPRNLKDFEFHFWVKLSDATPLDKAINMVAIEASHNNADIKISFWLDPCKGQAINACLPGGFKPTLSIESRYSPDDVQMTRTQHDEIKIEEYRHLIASIDKGLIKITVDGAVMQIPYGGGLGDEDSAELERPWIFRSFFVGLASSNSLATSYNGITGSMDQFHVDKLAVDPNWMSNANRSYSAFITFLISAVAFLFML